MSLEIAIQENTAAIRELIAALANGTPVAQAEPSVTEAKAVKVKQEKAEAKAKPDPKPEVVAEVAEPAATPEQKDEPAAVEVTTADTTVTAADVTAAVISLGKAGKRPELIELLGKYRVNKGSELAADQLAPFHADATALLEG